MAEFSEVILALDLALILERLGGDKELFQEIAGMFLEEYPVLLAEIREAIDTGDARKLERSAHTLKGAVSNFASPEAHEAAFRLEKLGRNAQLAEAPQAFHQLDSILRQLGSALTEMVKA